MVLPCIQGEARFSVGASFARLADGCCSSTLISAAAGAAGRLVVRLVVTSQRSAAAGLGDAASASNAAAASCTSFSSLCACTGCVDDARLAASLSLYTAPRLASLYILNNLWCVRCSKSFLCRDWFLSRRNCSRLSSFVAISSVFGV